ncbi:hypothetical protein O2N63_13725 [Aliiroseovarius sp. KMU-50]|uniref:FAD/NAD(P)-binding domain-containing protein n=1 Tax=Aliiroseovarius salicola TaxID=3009082 RepID=A0ABT4W3P9_9RHOB|nr:hypothetical protein [Aliiroseovarius sp. KMU-50]MDA5095142.1 hypothetical protein [Aliiroseovarius sp. KMU-50]
MLDTPSALEPEIPTSLSNQHYDLIIVGAGVCGLNALYVATKYLPATARIALIERRDAAAGMWQSTYDYVRLHQPHPMFTVGNMAWDLDQPRQYLARGAEVRDHLQSCLAKLKYKLRLDEFYGHVSDDIEEVASQGGHIVRTNIKPVVGGPAQTLTADRAIYAAGYAISEMQPLECSSDNVISTAPGGLPETLADNPGAPVYVIGGGKTSMDTVMSVMADNGSHQINVINGPGTYFINRNNVFPLGMGRWSSGSLISQSFADLALKFDGTNESELNEYAFHHYGICPTGTPGQSMFGILSEEEGSQIKEGIEEIIPGYLEDVIDTANGPKMIMRDGSRVTVPDGAIFVNCTGCYFHDHPNALDRPCVSRHGRLITITKKDSLHFMTSVAGYFLTHIMFLGKHQSVPLYAIDAEALNKKSRHAYFAADATQIYLNLMLWSRNMPMNVLLNCGLDLDRWFPLPRRAAAALGMLAKSNAHMAHCRASLDKVADVHGVTCRPIC